MRIGIVGAGIVGRLLALQLSQYGHDVSLFTKNSLEDNHCTSYVAAGMLMPCVDIENHSDIIFELGVRSLALWPLILRRLVDKVTLQYAGALVVAHAQEQAELHKLQQRMEKRFKLVGKQSGAVQWLNQQQLRGYTAELNFPHALYVRQAGAIHNTQLLLVLVKTLIKNKVTCYEHCDVSAIQPHLIVTREQTYKFDEVFDCRGLGAKVDYPDLRGVRGELVWLQAPHVKLNYPIRFLHPRMSIYIVPRQENQYVIGASEIESEDRSPISVQTMLELLSAAYSVHPGFAEARIIKTLVACRPAFIDNLPRVYIQEGLIAINGLYRYGYLLAPILVEQVCQFLRDGSMDLPPDCIHYR